MLKLSQPYILKIVLCLLALTYFMLLSLVLGHMSAIV